MIPSLVIWAGLTLGIFMGVRACRYLLMPRDTEAPAPGPIPCGYSIRSNDFYPEIGPEELIIRRIIPYGMSPSDTTIYVKYTDGAERTLDLTPYTFYDQITDEEKAEIENIVAKTFPPNPEEDKIGQIRNQLADPPKIYYSGTPVFCGTGIYSGSFTIETPEEKLRKELIKKLSWDWLPVYYSASPKPAPKQPETFLAPEPIKSSPTTDLTGRCNKIPL